MYRSVCIKESVHKFQLLINLSVPQYENEAINN